MAIIPYDSPHRDRLIGHAEPHAARIVTFGIDQGADVRAVETMRTPTGGTFVTASLGEKELSFTVGQPGMHWVSNALAVLAAVDAVGGDLALAGLALAELGGLAGRGARLTVKVAGGEALVIDESYNANPTSMRATLAVLAAEKDTQDRGAWRDARAGREERRLSRRPGRAGDRGGRRTGHPCR